jgi:DNA-binding Lrp family transcriptional regulator
MAKSSMETMTQDEIQVLAILEQHAKESADEIAKRCGFSRQKVWKIIKHLEEKKIIWGYTAVSDENASNLKHFIVLVKRNNMPFDQDVQKEVIFRKIDEYPEGLVKIENIYLTNGINDWVFTFYAPDLVSAKKFIALTFERFNKYLKEYFILETLVPIRKQGLKNPQIKELVKYI